MIRLNALVNLVTVLCSTLAIANPLDLLGYPQEKENTSICKLFITEYGASLTEQLKVNPDLSQCDYLKENEFSIKKTSLPMSPIQKIEMKYFVWDRDINCDLDKIVNNDTGFSRPPTFNQNGKYYFPAGGKGCRVTENLNGQLKTTQLIKKFSKYDGKPLKEIIGADQNLTFYYPNNIDVKVPYANGGSLYTPFAFTGMGTTIYASANLNSVSQLLFLSGMKPVTFFENGKEFALVMIIIYNFHQSGVGPYTEFQLAPVVQPDTVGQTLPAFSSLDEFLKGLETAPKKGFSKSYEGKLSVWQNHLVISSYDASFAELAIKGGRGVSYPKYLGEQQQRAFGYRLSTWVSQNKTAVTDDFNLNFSAIFPQPIQSLKYTEHLDQSLKHVNLSPTTNKWCHVIVQSNSSDSNLYARDFEPKGPLHAQGDSSLAKKINAMQLQPKLAQISKDIKGATWTTKRDCGPSFYDENSFMNPLP